MKVFQHCSHAPLWLIYEKRQQERVQWHRMRNILRKYLRETTGNFLRVSHKTTYLSFVSWTGCSCTSMELYASNRAEFRQDKSSEVFSSIGGVEVHKGRRENLYPISSHQKPSDVNSSSKSRNLELKPFIQSFCY